MDNALVFNSFWLLCALFIGAAVIELIRERKPQLHYHRGLAIVVSLIAVGIFAAQSWNGSSDDIAGIRRDAVVAETPRETSYISHIEFDARRLFSILSIGILLAGIMFCPAAPLVRTRMSKVFGLQALLYALIHVHHMEGFLVIGLFLAVGFILAVRNNCKRLTDDERRFLRARSFLLYQSTAVLCLLVSLGLRILDRLGVLPFSEALGVIDAVSLCTASAILMGMFPFHGWVLPFLGSPRATVFLPMLCIQSGLLFFFRVYAPTVTRFGEYSAFFLAVPVVGLLYSAILFFGESRLKRIPGNLYLNHVCLMAITVVGLDAASYTAAILDSVNTLVATLGLIGLCALLTSRFGVRGVISPTGLGSFFPEIAVCYLICVLSLVSFPGTLGFIEEEVVLGQAVGHQNLLVAAIAIALTLNGFSSFRLFARVFMGQPALGQDTETGLMVRERIIIYTILAVIVLNGLAPSYIVDSLSHMGHVEGSSHATLGR